LLIADASQVPPELKGLVESLQSICVVAGFEGLHGLGEGRARAGRRGGKEGRSVTSALRHLVLFRLF
jgi:hypothetical protein